MRRRVVPLGVAALLLSAAAQTRAQVEEGADREAFLAGAEEAATLYADRREAMADGFRRIGPDFPGMGVHWVNTARIVSPELRGERPAVLCYATIDGETRLVGLAYAVPLAPDESPPAEPFGADAWHDHSRDVSEESLLLNHPASVMAADPTFRLSMVHVWMPLENPAGLVEQNNWSLPFLRVGLRPPRRPRPAAARGLSLGSAGAEYYRELLFWAVELSERERALVDGALRARADEVDDWIDRRRQDPTSAGLEELERVWHALWSDLERVLAADDFERVRPLRADGE